MSNVTIKVQPQVSVKYVDMSLTVLPTGASFREVKYKPYEILTIKEWSTRRAKPAYEYAQFQNEHAYQSIDAEAELTKLLTEEINKAILAEAGKKG